MLVIFRKHTRYRIFLDDLGKFNKKIEFFYRLIGSGKFYSGKGWHYTRSSLSPSTCSPPWSPPSRTISRRSSVFAQETTSTNQTRNSRNRIRFCYDKSDPAKRQRDPLLGWYGTAVILELYRVNWLIGADCLVVCLIYDTAALYNLVNLSEAALGKKTS